ncbi:MAG: flagellar basal body L-ring protein FlgH [Magnetospirillum sp. WYHS-4]
MTSSSHRILGTTAALLLTVGLASGCKTMTRLAEVGDGPSNTKIVNPTARADYKPVSMPMPAPKQPESNPNSLWRSGARAFFKDHRAKEIGDIVTVKLALSDSAKFNNTTERERADSEDTDVNTLLGLEAEWRKVLPQGVAAGGQLFNFGNAHKTKGDGSIDRSESLSLVFAAVVTQVLPNGYFAIMGRQEILVNAEMRELAVAGVVRPEDIESDNTVSHDKIAEMRVAYGGRGTLSDLQAPRWGTQVWDVIFPF